MATSIASTNATPTRWASSLSSRTPRRPTTASAAADSIEQAAWAQRHLLRPEIPIDIVNLGLVYACTAEPIDKDSYRLAVKMTLTAPGCGMGTLIADEAREAAHHPGRGKAEVELVWDPPWSREMMSEAARLEMGMMW